jgi:hypothetical protein
MALAGMRDIRDYLPQVRSKNESRGLASPFNIAKERLTLANFSCEQINALYHQHTDATGQIFEASAISRAWYWSEGQPWLVNALAYQAVSKLLDNDYNVSITAETVDKSAEMLILHRDAHLDSLLEPLREPRVRKVMEPIILKDSNFPEGVYESDLTYVIDLGLIKLDNNKFRPSNPIYQEAILRYLTDNFRNQQLLNGIANRWTDGKSLDMNSLLKAFQRFWRENSGILGYPCGYREAYPQLVCYGYLQRVLNSGACVSGEYALGGTRVDIIAFYKGLGYPLELKVVRSGESVSLKAKDGLKQLHSYMDTSGAKEGWLLVFDTRPNKSWNQRIYWKTNIGPKGMAVHIVGC